MPSVLIFISENGFNADERKKILWYYETRELATSDGKDIRDWRALAPQLDGQNSIICQGKQSKPKTTSKSRTTYEPLKIKLWTNPSKITKVQWNISWGVEKNSVPHIFR